MHLPVRQDRELAQVQAFLHHFKRFRRMGPWITYQIAITASIQTLSIGETVQKANQRSDLILVPFEEGAPVVGFKLGPEIKVQSFEEKFLVLQQYEMSNIIDDFYATQEKACLSMLESVFPDLNETELLELWRHSKIKHFRPGEVLMEKGMTVQNYYIVRSGFLEVEAQEKLTKEKTCPITARTWEHTLVQRYESLVVGRVGVGQVFGVHETLIQDERQGEFLHEELRSGTHSVALCIKCRYVKDYLTKAQQMDFK